MRGDRVPGWSAINNAAENLARAKIASGFGFWENTAGFDISQTLIEYQATSTYGRAFWVGLINTLVVAGLGIVLATILGFLIGIARLSKNWLVARIAGVYVETHPQHPAAAATAVLVQRRAQGAARHARKHRHSGRRYSSTTAACSCRSRYSSRRRALRSSRSCWALLASIGYRVWARRRQMRTGQQAPVLWVTLGLVVALPLAVLALSGFPISFDFPEAGRFNIRGGMEMLPEFMALLFGLVIYTAAFIAEVVRAGILFGVARPDRGGLFARAAARADLAPCGRFRRRCA